MHQIFGGSRTDDDGVAVNKKFELTVFHKADGPLTKQIFLNNGQVNANGAACKMARGDARRVKLGNVSELAKLIGGMPSDEALTLGVFARRIGDAMGLDQRFVDQAVDGAGAVAAFRPQDGGRFVGVSGEDDFTLHLVGDRAGECRFCRCQRNHRDERMAGYRCAAIA
jgi:hypothetical protein